MMPILPQHTLDPIFFWPEWKKTDETVFLYYSIEREIVYILAQGASPFSGNLTRSIHTGWGFSQIIDKVFFVFFSCSENYVKL